MKSRTWFLLSLLLFIAAFFVWRFAEERRLATHNSKEQTALHSKESTAASRKAQETSVSSKKPASSQTSVASSSTNSTNEVVLYPHRLQNTTQTLDQLVRNEKAILLRNALIDTGGERVKIPDELRAKGDPGSYVVQARGVADVTFHAALREANAEIISYVPNNAYLVRLNGSEANALQGNKRVQSVLPYEPHYKLWTTALPGEDDLLGMALDGKPLPPEKPLRVTLFPGEVDSAVNALKGKARILGEDLKSSPFGPELIVASADLVHLANLPQVQEIEPFYEREKLNDLTRVRTGVSTDTITLTNLLDLTGLDVWVNVNDSTIDTNHIALKPRVSVGVGDGTDEDGHGTHVAGIIAGDGAGGPLGDLLSVGSVSGANFRGAAPGAKIFSLDIFAPALSDARMHEIAATHSYLTEEINSPLISNNSWGYGARNYNSSAASFDAAVRDALPGTNGSQPIVYVFAAGNSGGGNDNGQGGSSGSVVSPATAKNVISVGAIENLRNITNEVTRPDASCITNTIAEFLGSTDSSNQVASFSSRGNVGVSQEGAFGRLKPDVVAPGTWIASTRSQQLNETNYYSPTHVDSTSSPNRVLDPLATNYFSLFVPDDPCDVGTTLSLTINAIVTTPSSPPLSLLIFTGELPAPSVTPGTFRGANGVTIDRADLPLDNILFYDIVNTNDVEVTYTLQTILVLSNDFGDYFQVVSNLNGKLAPNYMFESGTSMAAPAISGMLALMQEFFEGHQITNSPAMMKALLINGSRSVGPEYTYERERSINRQGWGLPELPQILSTNPDPANWPVRLFDQSTNALATGEQHDRVVSIGDTNSPLRVTLVWTDPPGNPAVGVKLVNDLDLVITAVVTNSIDTNGVPVTSTNVYFGNNFPGGDFTQPVEAGTNGLANFDTIRDSVNNVENVYINGPLAGHYTVSVVARRVNVNAVTAHTNGIVQDYALVISSGDNQSTVPMTVTTNVVPANTNSFVTVVTNGIPVLNQRVGANSPLQNLNPNNLTDGTNTQWRFYVLNNPDPGTLTNIAFGTFLPPNLSGASNTIPGSRRILEADIDLYVSSNPGLTNLNPAVLAAADKSLTRGGQELIVFTNRNDSTYYIGVKSEDQRASEFSFFAIASKTPFSEEDEDGNIIVHGIPPSEVTLVTDGSADNPGAGRIPLIMTHQVKVGRVIVANRITHERFGDLIGTLASPSGQSAVLINHSFPDGLEGGTFTGIYDDSGLGLPPYFEPFEVRSVDGPGSLLDFVEVENTVGMWSFSLEDNAVNATGQVEMVEMYIERALETNELADGTGFEISSTSIPGGQSRGLSFIVPENATNMIISISPKTGSIDTVVRRGRLMPTRSPYVDHGKVINSPGGNLIVGTTSTPPLRPGRYTLRLFNDGGAPVTLVGLVRFELDLALRSQQTLTGGTAPLIDDAATNSIIHVDRDARVTSTEVSVRINHPRVSDLVLHLVSPQGTRILLAENRGGVSTNGYGFSNLQTNYFPATTSGGGSAAQTNTFGPVLPSGYINIDYQFFDQDPDRMQVFYDGRVIYDTGIAFGTNSVLIPYGPGVGTDIVVVMNPDGNANSGTAWNYTLSVLSGELVYATFSENTNITRVPIKFAIPPFATNLPADKVTFDSSYFEDPTAATTYNAPATFDGWTLTSNSVAVVEDALRAHRGTNYLNMGSGAPAITRTLPTTNGGFYNLRFAYRRGEPAILSSANVSLDGIFTNQFIGNPNWVNHSMSFVATQNGTKLDIVGSPSPGGGSGGLHNLIVNGSFESGLTGWTRNNAGVQLNPFTPTIPSTDGTNSVYIGINNVPNSVLSQTFPVNGGSSYELSFDFFVSCLEGNFGAMRVTLSTSQGTLFSQAYTNFGPNFPPFTIDSKSIPFTVPPGVTTATVSFADVSPNNGVACDPVLDNVRVLSPSSETVYVANNGNGLVRGFTVDGVDLGNITTVPAPFAQGIAIDFVGNIYVVSVTGDHIRRYSPSGVDLGIFASTGISDARAMVFDASGNLYVANAGTDNPTNSVRRFSPTGVDLGDFISTGLLNATGMDFDEAGNLYVANYSLNQVKKYAPDGTYLGIAISAGLNQPIGLAVIPQAQGGGFYVANDFASSVYRYDAAGNIVDTLTSGSLGRLHYLALDSVGNVYVSRFTGNAVRKFSPTGQDLGDVAIAGLNGPAGIVVKEEKAPAMWFDTFELTEGGDPNYFLPEESLKTLIGENAEGDWKLEVWDNRAGAPLGLAQLISWQLHLTFDSTAATATTVLNGVPTVTSVAGSEIKYFVVDVPLFATRATNVLVSGGGPLNLLFNQEELPIGGPNTGDSLLLSGTVNGTSVLTFNTDPDLQPGRRYYLGVQNVNPLQTNTFTLTVSFDNTNNLVNVTPLAKGVPVSTNLPLGQSIHYYQYDVSSNASQVVFRLLNPSDDADLVVRRGLLPTASSYDFNSVNAGTNSELVDINLSSAPPLAAGRYYVGVYGFFPTNGITYTVLANESASFAPIGEFFNSPTFTASGVILTAGTIPGETYELLVSTNLVDWTVVDTITATGNQTSFTDPNPPAEDTARFYQLRQLP